MRRRLWWGLAAGRSVLDCPWPRSRRPPRFPPARDGEWGFLFDDRELEPSRLPHRVQQIALLLVEVEA